MPTQVFISYGREDVDAASRLETELQSEEVAIWLDRSRLSPGERWKPAIAKAIRESDYFIALLSSSSVNRRGFVNTEIREALSIVSELPANRPFIIPARLDECEPAHPELIEFNRVDLFRSWSDGVNQMRDLFEGTSRKAPVFNWMVLCHSGTLFEEMLERLQGLPGVQATHANLGKSDLFVQYEGSDPGQQLQRILDLDGVKNASLLLPVHIPPKPPHK